MSQPGIFIVIEGTDGSGKGTHTSLVIPWLESQNYKVLGFDFPQYGKPSAHFVEEYLNGKYGGLADVSPYRGSLFYALDRFDAGFAIREAVNSGVVVVSNRYVGSNMGHQGGKIVDSYEREQYFTWNDHLEYDILGIPRPDVNIVLHMPSEQAQMFVDQKSARQYLGEKKRDIHENDLDHLRNAERTYLEMCQKFPDTFKLVPCHDGQAVRPIPQIQSDIRTLITSALAKKGV